MEAKLITGWCPSCKGKLAFDPNSTSPVTCNFCDTVSLPGNILRTAPGSGNRPSSGAAAAANGLISAVALSAMDKIETPESALVYLQNVYERFDWKIFRSEGELYPQFILDFVEDKKMRTGATPLVWLLDFNAKVRPLKERVQGLRDLEQEMVNAFDPEDYTRALQIFDSYKFSMDLLFEQKESIIQDLLADINNAEQFKLEPAKLAQMRQDLDQVSGLLETVVHEAKDLNDEPAIQRAQAEHNQRIAAKLASQGIDAPSTYQAAVEAFKANNFAGAATLFTKIIGYSNTSVYLKKLEQNFKIRNSLIVIGAKEYYLKPTEEKDYTFNVKNPGDEGGKKGLGCGKKPQQPQQPQEQPKVDVRGLSLFAINDEQLLEKDRCLVAGITDIITLYAGKMIFIQKNKDLCVFNSMTNTTTILLPADEGDFQAKGVEGKEGSKYQFYFNNDHTGIFFRKKLALQKAQEEKGGCALKKKKEPEGPTYIFNPNNFSLLYLDLRSDMLVELVHEIVDIVEYNQFAVKNDNDLKIKVNLSEKMAEYGDIIFYISSRRANNDPNAEWEEKIYIYSLKQKLEIGVIESDYDIEDIVNNFVIFTQWDPSDWNKHLYVLNTDNNEVVLIEDNILDFKFANKDHIFYTVGNDDVAPMFYNNYAGTARQEILKRAERFIASVSGWLYVKKGSKANAVLMKISEDGKQKVPVCSQFVKAIKITPSHVFYLDWWGRVCVAKVDGTEDRWICEDVRNIHNVIVSDKHLYMFKWEDADEDKECWSIYSVQLDGRNLKKLEFNCVNAGFYDEKTIYYYKEIPQRYEFTDYDEKGNERKQVVDYTYWAYVKYHIDTGERENVLLSDPLSAEPIVIKYGCFGRKKKTLTPNYKLIPEKIRIRRHNVASSGAVSSEKIVDDIVNGDDEGSATPAQTGCLGALAKPANGKQAKGNDQGKKGGCGCASLFAKKKK